MNALRTSSPRRAFTLIELLVVIAIIGILAALVFPITSKGLESGRRLKCANNVHQIALAAGLLFDQDQRYLPNVGADATLFGNTAALLLPTLGESLEVFDCPSNKGLRKDAQTLIPGATNVYTEYELNGYLASVTGLRRPVSGITSPPEAAYAYDFPWFDADRAHGEGINVGYLDGHAAWLPASGFGSGTSAFYRLGHEFE